jgi:RasGEF domain
LNSLLLSPTLVEYSLLKKVTAPEIQSQNWTKNKKRAPNIAAVIKNFNRMGQWVATEVLTTSVKENRETVIRKFIEIANHLREMQNYSTCLAIMSGLSHNSVSRLKRTWKAIPKKSRDLLNDLYRLIKPGTCAWRWFRAFIFLRVRM